VVAIRLWTLRCEANAPSMVWRDGRDLPPPGKSISKLLRERLSFTFHSNPGAGSAHRWGAVVWLPGLHELIRWIRPSRARSTPMIQPGPARGCWMLARQPAGLRPGENGKLNCWCLWRSQRRQQCRAGLRQRRKPGSTPEQTPAAPCPRVSKPCAGTRPTQPAATTSNRVRPTTKRPWRRPGATSRR